MQMSTMEAHHRSRSLSSGEPAISEADAVAAVQPRVEVLRSTRSAAPSEKCAAALRGPCRGYLRFRKRRLVTVEPVQFLYMFGVAVLGLAISRYVFNRYGQEQYAKYGHEYTKPTCITQDDLDKYTNTSESAKEVQEWSSLFILFNGLAEQLPSIVAVLLCGPISDRIGRKPLILLVSLAACLYGALALVVVHLELSVYYLLPLAFLHGLTGAMSSMHTAVFAYLADVSSTKWLTARVGILEAVMFVGLTLSFASTGLWLRQSNCDFTGPFLVYIGCNALIVLYTLVFLPESLTSAERREGRRDQRWGPCTLIVRGIKMFFTREYSRWRLWSSLISLAIFYFNGFGGTSIMIFFLLNAPLEWNTGLIGIYLSLTFMLHGVALVVVFPVMLLLGMPDTLLVIGGAVVNILGFTFTGLVRNTWEMFTGIASRIYHNFCHNG